MQPLIRHELDDYVAFVAHSTRGDGDLSPADVEPNELNARRAHVVDHPWHALRQVHSDRVLIARGEPSAERPVGDALVTTDPRTVLAVHSGDCVPVGFVSLGGAVAVAHAGWKGLEAGVIESTVRRIRDTVGADEIKVAVGPHIRTAQYEFGCADLERLARRFGDHVVGTTERGAQALDLTAAVVGECARLGLEVAAQSNDCSARDADRYWSHRARQESGRIALIAWLEERSDDR